MSVMQNSVVHDWKHRSEVEEHHRIVKALWDVCVDAVEWRNENAPAGCQFKKKAWHHFSACFIYHVCFFCCFITLYTIHVSVFLPYLVYRWFLIPLLFCILLFSSLAACLLHSSLILHLLFSMDGKNTLLFLYIFVLHWLISICINMCVCVYK